MPGLTIHLLLALFFHSVKQGRCCEDFEFGVEQFGKIRKILARAILSEHINGVHLFTALLIDFRIQASRSPDIFEVLGFSCLDLSAPNVEFLDWRQRLIQQSLQLSGSFARSFFCQD